MMIHAMFGIFIAVIIIGSTCFTEELYSLGSTTLFMISLSGFSIPLALLFHSYNEDINKTYHTLLSKLNKTISYQPKEVKEDVIKDNYLINLYESIIEKINQLLQDDIIKNDLNYSLLLNSAKNNYVPKIMSNYFSIPDSHKFEVSADGISPREFSIDQLNMILEEINKIENEIIDLKLRNIKVMNKFLQSKFQTVEKEKNE